MTPRPLVAAAVIAVIPAPVVAPAVRHATAPMVGMKAAPAAEGGFNDVCRSGRDADRKSTRLNSSHLVISYAVFCLKKKNIYVLVALICACFDRSHMSVLALQATTSCQSLPSSLSHHTLSITSNNPPTHGEH